MLNRSLKCNPHLIKIGQIFVPEHHYGDMKLSVFPFKHDDIQLPFGFKLWENTIKNIMMYVPKQTIM